MSYSADDIINVQARISPAGLGNANFASAMLFAGGSEIPAGFVKDTYRVYSKLTDLAVDFADTTETYKAAARWLGGTPNVRKLTVWATDSADLTLTATLNKARNIIWWYWTLLTQPVMTLEAKAVEAAQWCEVNRSMFVNTATGAKATAVRNPVTITDIASQLTTLGIRHAYTACHATDGYAGNALAKHFSVVNYSADRSTITGETKKSPGIAAENLSGTEWAAMMQDSKKATFYTVVDLQGSSDIGRWINTRTHSTYGEFIDDVINLDAFINYLTVELYNTLSGQVTKLAQTPAGQAVLLAAAKKICEQFIANGYLGARNYTDPDTGLEAFTLGYEILTKPEDILDLSSADRSARKSAPIRIRLFRAGAIHLVDVAVDVY